MTLQEILKTKNLEQVAKNCVKKHVDYGDKKYSKEEKEYLEEGYFIVAEKIANYERENAKYAIFIKKEKDAFGGGEYIDVCFLNQNYIAPPEGLKPWGCIGDAEPPEGHYDCNADKYQQYFSCCFASWGEMAHSEIILQDGLDLNEDSIATEMLWELTFYGFNEESIKEEEDKLRKSIEEIKSGECETISLEDIKNKWGLEN